MARPPVQSRAQSPLPSLAGVGASCVALPSGNWRTLLEFLCQRFPGVTDAAWRERMARGEVVDEHGARLGERTAYRAAQRIYYYRQISDEPRIPFDEQILFCDERLLAVDKPHFLPVTPGGPYLHETLLVRLKRRLGMDELVPIHRIDRETAGVVLFSVDRRSRGAYQTLFRDRRVHKQYEAVVQRPCAPLPRIRRSRLTADGCFFRMREGDGEANAETHLELLGQTAELAHYRLWPVTGKKHQLRVHCAALGAPILHDRFYPELRALAGDPDDHERPLQLLARSLSFDDPLSGQRRRFVSQQALRFVPSACDSAPTP